MDDRLLWRQILKSGLAYGVGLLIGNILTFIIFDNLPTSQFLSGSQVVRLVLGILLAFAISGMGGLLGGAVGGASLPAVGKGRGRWGYTWRSGVTFGFGYGLLLFPFVLVVTLLGYYDVAQTPSYVFSLAFGIVGLVFGVIMGLSLGLWTVGRRFPPITRSSAVAFAMGGMLLGYCLWRYLFALSGGEVEAGPYGWIMAGLFLFAGSGGTGLGYAYDRSAATIRNLPAIRASTFRGWRRTWTVIGVGVVLLLLFVRPIIAAVGDLLTPVDAGLSAVLELATTGTHWLDSAGVASVTVSPQPAITTGPEGQLALAWIEEDRLLARRGHWRRDILQTIWEEPFLVSEGTAAAPAVALDSAGALLLVWTTGETILVTRCEGDICATPRAIGAPASCGVSPGVGNRSPVLAISEDRAVLVWANEAGILPYASWPTAEAIPVTAAGCVPLEQGASAPRIAAGGGAWALVAEGNSGTVQRALYDGESWLATGSLAQGEGPAIFVDGTGQPHSAWCADGQVHYAAADLAAQVVAGASCTGGPALALDERGQPHVVWQGNEVLTNTGELHGALVLYESVAGLQGWTEPAIAGRSSGEGQPALAAAADGSLHLAWAGPELLSYAAQVQYQCADGEDLSRLSRILYDIARDPAYTPADDPIPYCGNRYDRILVAPNPDPAFSDETPRPNGVFDVLADLIRGAQYEVLYSTMWYDAAINDDSPGSVIAGAVGDLYANLRAHPEEYPRGITVRIMLGNPPELIIGETAGQLWNVLADLRAAGIDTMVDEEIGWRLEVADYEGNLPHSHVKTAVIDGKVLAVNGFNMSYPHFPSDHPSGEGNDRFDLGLQVTGPLAQAGQRIFDDMWAGADERYCLDFNPPLGLPWQATCFDRTATTGHVPEVLKFFLPGADDHAFSLYRSRVHDQADQQIIGAMQEAEQSVDAVHVNFTLDTICNLNILFNVCTVDIEPGYQDGLLRAARNGAQVRVIVKPSPVEGIENTVALEALRQRLESLGLLDRYEVRFFEGAMHAKSALIDDELLIIGSQNLHYSAFGEGGGLNEYSLATDSARAIDDYRRIFEHYWERSVPAWER